MSERISIPQKNIPKFKEVLLYVLEKVGAFPNVGETVLNKLLYFIDFDHYERFEEQLIGATYIKNKHGPTPIELEHVKEEMLSQKEIKKMTADFYGKKQKKYFPLRDPNLDVLNGNEIKTIDEVLEKHAKKNADQISDYSHRDVPWLVTKPKNPINYESVFYRTDAYSVRLNG